MKGIKFTKMHGIGNDYVYINCVAGPAEARTESCPADPATLAREVSDRHTGIGGDGLILILPSEKADFRMRMFNADGSEGRMCGNASRCIAALLHSRNIISANPINLETLSGVKVLTLNMEGDEVSSVTVDMGAPVLDTALVPVTCDTPRMTDMPVDAGSETLRLTAVSMGNPHGVTFVDALDDVDFDRLGPLLERHPMWPDRANIEFAEVLDPGHIRVRVWERGSGETLACGTGACAVAVAAILTGRARNEVTVSLRGGDLKIEWPGTPGSSVLMTGTATEVFTGTYTRRR